MIKCSIFDKLSDFNRFNFGIINFDKNIYTEKNNVIFNGNSEKLLYVQSNEPTAPYFMMGILKNTDINSGEVEEKYAVETLMAPFNVSDFFCCSFNFIVRPCLRAYWWVCYYIYFISCNSNKWNFIFIYFI